MTEITSSGAERRYGVRIKLTGVPEKELEKLLATVLSTDCTSRSIGCGEESSKWNPEGIIRPGVIRPDDLPF